MQSVIAAAALAVVVDTDTDTVPACVTCRSGPAQGQNQS